MQVGRTSRSLASSQGLDAESGVMEAGRFQDTYVCSQNCHNNPKGEGGHKNVGARMSQKESFLFAKLLLIKTVLATNCKGVEPQQHSI